MPFTDRRAAIFAVLALVGLGGCVAEAPAGQAPVAGEQAAAAHDSVVYVREAMQEQINPAIFAIWDIGNNAMSDDGGIDPAQMDAAKWSTLESAAADLASSSREMAAGTTIRAARDDNMDTMEGEVTMAAVQGFIDADPDGFRAFSMAQAQHSDRLVAAAQAQDAAAAGDLVAGLDAVCEACHARYWYPE